MFELRAGILTLHDNCIICTTSHILAGTSLPWLWFRWWVHFVGMSSRVANVVWLRHASLERLKLIELLLSWIATTICNNLLLKVWLGGVTLFTCHYYRLLLLLVIDKLLNIVNILVLNRLSWSWFKHSFLRIWSLQSGIGRLLRPLVFLILVSYHQSKYLLITQ